ncbi:hypothetical protein D3C76_00990 [compost metagenome]
MNLSGQQFFHDQENDVFYLVNFQERRYMKIAEKGSQFYDLCQRLYCTNWKYAECNYKIISTFRKVERLAQIDGCED